MMPYLSDFQIRAIDGTRTRDPRLGKPMLYQLSHYRVLIMQNYAFFCIYTRNQPIILLVYLCPPCVVLVLGAMLLLGVVLYGTVADT